MFGAHRSRARRGCNCETGAAVATFGDATAGITVPALGAGTSLTVCSPDSDCGASMLTNAAFQMSDPNELIRSTLLATHTVSVMARVETLDHSQILVTYTAGSVDSSATQNYLLFLIIRQGTGLANLWEYGTGVNVEFASNWFPEIGKWYLFTTRMTIGASTVCELLVDGIVVGTSGSLTNATSGTISVLGIGNEEASPTYAHEGATAFVDISSVARSNDYLKNLRGFGRAWGRDGSTVARLVPQVA